MFLYNWIMFVDPRKKKVLHPGIHVRVLTGCTVLCCFEKSLDLIPARPGCTVLACYDRVCSSCVFPDQITDHQGKRFVSLARPHRKTLLFQPIEGVVGAEAA